MRQAAAFALLTLVLAAAPGARHAVAERLLAGYEIEWQGLQIGAFETELVTEPAGYRLSYRARTMGFLGWLFPFTSAGWSEGTRTAARPRPQHYRGGSRWRDRSSAWAVRFGTDGRATHVELARQDRHDREPVPAALQVAPDPLALALAAVGVAGPGVRLAGTSFDGKRAIRFEFACSDDLVPLAGLPAATAAGAAPEGLKCTVDGELAAGASRRWPDHHEGAGERGPAAVWLGRGILEDAFWPVRVEADTRYGIVTIRLVSLEPASGTSAAEP